MKALEKYKVLFENASDLIAVVDPDGTFLELNKKFESELLYKREEFLGKRIQDCQILTKKSTDQLTQKLSEILIGRELEPFKIEGIRKDGTRVPFEVQAVPLEMGGKIVEIQAIFRNITERKKTEEKLRFSEEKFRLAFQTSPDSVNINRLRDGMYIDVNEGFLKITGYSRKEVIGKTSNELKIWANPEDREKLVTGLKKHGVVDDLEASFRMKSGRVLTGLMSACVITLDGEPCILNITRNIEEYKRTRRELSRSAEKYRQLFINIPIGMLSINTEGDILEVNPAILEMLGSPSIEATKAINLFKFKPLIQAGISADLKACIKSGIPAVHEREYTSAWGKPINMRYHLTPTRGPGGEIIGLVANIENISERVAAERALRSSEERFRSIVENSHEVICIIDSKLKIEYVNPRLTEVFGYEPSDLTGKDLRRYLDKESNTLIHQLTKTYLSEETMPARHQINIKHADGEVRGAEVSISIFRDSSEQIRIVAQILDITEKIKLEQQFRQAQKMEAIGHLAGGVAHDFNNILTVINGYAELGIYQSEESNPLNTYFSEISKSGRRAESLTRQLLGFSRRQLIQPVTMNINTIISNLDNMLRRVIGEDIEMRVNLEKDINSINADSGQIEQVLMNIILNARDAIKQDTSKKEKKVISIETSNVLPDASEIQEELNAEINQYVLITIGDTGIGMTPETMEQIFEPFFTTKGRERGTGLGLATVYGIVKQNNGQIFVESTLHKGTKFKVYWPAATGEKSFSSVNGKENRVRTGNEVVLLVEDDSAVRSLAAEMLNSLGYSVIMASNGLEALKIANEKGAGIQLLITDVIMPFMGGKELSDKLRNKFPELKIIYTSGYTDNDIVYKGELNGNINFLQKPYSINALSNKVRAVLSSKGSTKLP